MGTALLVTGTVAVMCSPTGGAAVLSGLLLQTKPNMRPSSTRTYQVFQTLKANNGGSIWQAYNSLYSSRHMDKLNARTGSLRRGTCTQRPPPARTTTFSEIVQSSRLMTQYSSSALHPVRYVMQHLGCDPALSRLVQLTDDQLGLIAAGDRI